jgi:hypothetical protein
VKQMRKRVWTVELRPQPASDGVDRLGLAVKLMVDRARPSAEPNDGSNVADREWPDDDGAEWRSDA